jgi:hypothetical protein
VVSILPIRRIEKRKTSFDSRGHHIDFYVNPEGVIRKQSSSNCVPLNSLNTLFFFLFAEWIFSDQNTRGNVAGCFVYANANRMDWHGALQLNFQSFTMRASKCPHNKSRHLFFCDDDYLTSSNNNRIWSPLSGHPRRKEQQKKKKIRRRETSVVFDRTAFR